MTPNEKEEEVQATPGDRVRALRKSFALIVFFALAVQILITVVWNVTSRPVLGIATPILAFMVLAVGVLAFTLGVLTNPGVRHPEETEAADTDQEEAALA